MNTHRDIFCERSKTGITVELYSNFHIFLFLQKTLFKQTKYKIGVSFKQTKYRQGNKFHLGKGAKKCQSIVFCQNQQGGGVHEKTKPLFRFFIIFNVGFCITIP